MPWHVPGPFTRKAYSSALQLSEPSFCIPPSTLDFLKTSSVAPLIYLCVLEPNVIMDRECGHKRSVFFHLPQVLCCNYILLLNAFPPVSAHMGTGSEAQRLLA